MSDNAQSAPKRRSKRAEQTPVQRALGLLVRREHSQRELMRKLLQRGVELEAAEAAVQRLADAGWQDEQRFAHSLVRNRAASGYGPLHVRAELAMHGLSSELIAEAMDSYEGDWSENARDLVRRRFASGLQERPIQRKAMEMLARRGFPGGIIRAATEGGAEDWDDQA